MPFAGWDTYGASLARPCAGVYGALPFFNQGGVVNARRLFSAAMMVAILGVSAGVSAQDTTTVTEIQAGHKGAIGLGMVGAEVGFIVGGVFADDHWWPYVVFPSVLGIGAGIAGHYAIDANNNGKLAVGALSLGMAFSVPAWILTVYTGRYDPGDEDTTEVEVTEAAASQRARARSGLVQYNGEFAMGAPGFTVVPRGSGDPLYGGERATRYDVTLVSGSF